MVQFKVGHITAHGDVGESRQRHRQGVTDPFADNDRLPTPTIPAKEELARLPSKSHSISDPLQRRQLRRRTRGLPTPTPRPDMRVEEHLAVDQEGRRTWHLGAPHPFPERLTRL